MGLLQNGFRDTVGVFRIYGSGALNGAVPQELQANRALTGSRRNLTAGEGIPSEKVGLPLGYGVGGSYQLPQKPGLVSARAYDNAITAAAMGLMGVPTSGSLEISVFTTPPTGTLIAWGVGGCLLNINTGGNRIEGSVKGVGTSTVVFTCTANILPDSDSPPARSGGAQLSVSCVGTAYPLDDASPERTGVGYINVTSQSLLGAVLDAVGDISLSVNGSATARPLIDDLPSYTASSSIHLSATTSGALPTNDTPPARNASSSFTLFGTASPLPENDAPPARTASATISFSGILTPYALGHMVGSALPYTELSPQSLADAVWSCQAADFTVTGTMGRKINDGGAGGLTTEQETWLRQSAIESASARKAAVNKAIITTNMDGGQHITIYEDDGLTPIFSFNLSLDGDSRIPV